MQDFWPTWPEVKQGMSDSEMTQPTRRNAPDFWTICPEVAGLGC